ncbi:tryptophan 2,3-dioxygenase family protein [Marivirga harenae]|uniref:tryptophan 2,3-dioxygenase family protein n=1 Tax=Marivirga harenae TaxID=2010992 RepID=UPI0026E0C839|nr:tryptophan 2,3-dioxygenase family protein [Marivirga harenae]WKV10833.1 tryptophan 2,3-dioxygenase family protein [Marivirga harenae]|tara:strand:- start:109002 stop:109994 length:993 start_codon:yes stop_codon:yes gene_type:complete
MNTEQINKSLEKLNLKYQSMGQDLSAYLDGLLLSNYTTYWDYISVDTLLTLQRPKTDFPDEEIFIMYHQITELYFKMCLNEMEQIANNGQIIGENGEDLGWNEKLDVGFFLRRINRMNKYFETLTHSFDIMVQGMEKEQFQRFRMALLPASGFQSAQYRLIEFASTPLIHLVRKEKKEACENASLEEKYEHIYWKEGATEVETGQKTLTLEQFEKKYKEEFLEWIKRFQDKNIYLKYLSLDQDSKNNEKLKEALRNFDLNVNVFWPLVHYKSAVRYLQQENKDVPATGGTNWQQYLPPRFQKRIFFPELWSKKEIEEWGKGWVIKEIFGE